MFLRCLSLCFLSLSISHASTIKSSPENDVDWDLLPHTKVVQHDKNTFYFSLMDNKIPLKTDSVEFVLPIDAPLSINFIKDGSAFYKDLLSLGETSISLKKHESEDGIVSFNYMDILKDEFSHIDKKKSVSEYVVNRSVNWQPNSPGVCVKEYFEPIRYNNKDLNPELIVCHMAKLK